jgi:FixJ family two-component response regulator
VSECECGAPLGRGAREQCLSCYLLPVQLRDSDVGASTREGRSAREIAEAIGIAERTVVRVRARLRERGRLQ